MPIRSLLLALTLPLLAASAPAQAPVPGNPAQSPFGPAPPIAAIPQELDALVSEPATHLSFTLDRSMLAQAGALFDDGSGVGTRTPASISAVTVTTYRYGRPAFYDPGAMATVVATYNAAGWKHLVNANATPARSAYPDQPITDLWLHFQGTEIDDLAVLIRAPRQMSLIQLSGSLRPLDLLHLAGHFGIPKVDPGAVMVPAPPGR